MFLKIYKKLLKSYFNGFCCLPSFESEPEGTCMFILASPYKKSIAGGDKTFPICMAVQKMSWGVGIAKVVANKENLLYNKQEL